MPQSYANPTSNSTTSSGKSFMNMLIAKLPFSYQIIDNITTLNPKFEAFNEISKTPDERIAHQSVFRSNYADDSGISSLLVNKNYQQFMYSGVEFDKIKRLQEYRRMATYAELNNCIDEICNDVLVEDQDKNHVTLSLSKESNYSEIIAEEIKKEWIRYISLFDFNKNGRNYFRDFLIDGELFWENVISTEFPNYGIIGLVRLPTEVVNPVYNNVQNDMLENFIVRRPVVNEKTKMVDKEELVIFDKNQISYIHSGIWNEDRSIKYPIIEYARRAYKLLSLAEDSIIIHRMRMAPERLVFNVDVGNMSTPKAEAHLKRFMQQYWSKKTYDSTTGRVINVYDPQSYNDSYFFSKRTGTEGTTVTTLEAKSNFGNLDDLYFYIKKLYDSMHVPKNRLNADDLAKDGEGITNEELKFAKFLISIQKNFAQGIKSSFIVHLKLRGLWKQYKIKERYLEIQFNYPSLYLELKKQQLFELKYNNFTNMSQNEGISNTFAQKEYLDWDEKKCRVNREWRRKDAIFQWELEQILTAGPNWKQQQQALSDATSEMTSAAGGASGGGGGGASELPEFGPSPNAGEGEGEGAGGETPANEPSATPSPTGASTATSNVQAASKESEVEAR